jgi:hypothetical protein
LTIGKLKLRNNPSPTVSPPLSSSSMTAFSYFRSVVVQVSKVHKAHNTPPPAWQIYSSYKINVNMQIILRLAIEARGRNCLGWEYKQFFCESSCWFHRLIGIMQGILSPCP